MQMRDLKVGREYYVNRYTVANPVTVEEKDIPRKISTWRGERTIKEVRLRDSEGRVFTEEARDVVCPWDEIKDHISLRDTVRGRARELEQLFGQAGTEIRVDTPFLHRNRTRFSLGLNLGAEDLDFLLDAVRAHAEARTDVPDAFSDLLD